MIQKLRRIKDKLCDSAGFFSCCEIHGAGEVMLTGCTCLVDFDECAVVVDTVNGRIRFEGEGLSIRTFRADLLSVCGNIKRVDFLGEGQ